MFDELLDRMFTKCPPHLTEMGYMREILGIRARYQRWKAVWDVHCNHSKRLILEAALACPRKGTVAVVGSGWLHDVPLTELASLYSRVLLVDLVHPHSVRTHVKKFRNVELIDNDITGVLEGVFAVAHQKQKPLPPSKPVLFLGEDIDHVVSLNLLSQLPCTSEHYLHKLDVHKDDVIQPWCRSLVRAHLDWLRELPGVVTLIADRELVVFDQEGREVRRKPTLYGEPMPFHGETWVWPLVPRRDKPPHHGEHLVVTGVADVKRGTIATA